MTEEAIQSRPDDLYCSTGCGCPHEEWTYRSVLIAIHHDSDEPIAVCALVGEYDHVDVPTTASTFAEARAQAFRWVDALLARAGGDANAPAGLASTHSTPDRG